MFNVGRQYTLYNIRYAVSGQTANITSKIPVWSLISLFGFDAARAFSTDPIDSPPFMFYGDSGAVGHDPPEPNDRFRILRAPMKSDRTSTATVIESYARNFFSYYYYIFFIRFFLLLLLYFFIVYKIVSRGKGRTTVMHGRRRLLLCCRQSGHKRTSGGHHRKSGSVLWLYARQERRSHNTRYGGKDPCRNFIFCFFFIPDII